MRTRPRRLKRIQPYWLCLSEFFASEAFAEALGLVAGEATERTRELEEVRCAPLIFAEPFGPHREETREPVAGEAVAQLAGALEQGRSGVVFARFILVEVDHPEVAAGDRAFAA